MTQVAARSRRWYQFSLRTLLVLVAVVAGLVFAYLKTIEPYRLQREAMAAISTLGGTYKTEDAPAWVRYLDKNAQDVVVVDLADCDKSEEYVAHLARLPRLRTLVVGGHQFGDEQIVAVGRIASLRGLVLDSTLVSDEGLAKLKTELSAIAIHESQRRACETCRQLGAILLPSTDDLVNKDRLLGDDADVRYFRMPPQSVSFDDKRVTDADLRWLINLKDVRSVSLDRTRIAGECLATLGSALDYLTLAETRVNDRTMQHIAQCTSLRVLDLSGTYITDRGVPHLETLTKLEYLRLPGTWVADNGVRSVAKLRQLKSFAAPASMGDRGLADLADLPMLEELCLTGSNVSDEGLEPLKRFKSLERLWCSQRITDGGVRNLEPCKRLTQLSIAGTGISPDGVERLKKALPKCDIDEVSRSHNEVRIR